MSLRQKDTKKIPYWLFSAGSEKTIHLGPVNDPSKIKSDKVEEALEYVKGKFEHYSTVETNLASLLKTEPNFTKALEYYETRTKSVLEYYVNKILEFSSFIPQPERNEHLSKRSAELVGILRRLEEELPTTKVKSKVITKLTNPILNQVMTRVAHSGFGMRQTKNLEELLKDIEKDLQDDKT